ncbi:YcxB family protein [Chitinophaga deserti]|uniref:YcxB family protein n=1 Tax=Chitinophaga deserti TaxID=2164099 RepID=UPI000D6D24C5|nr:YcxB family protein [Chitinophaga deserti]
MHLLQFTYKKEEVINALRFHFLRRGEIRVFRNTLIILLLATVIGYVFRVVNFNAMLGIVVMMVILGWAFWYLLPVSTYNKAATFRDSIRLRYNDEGMAIYTGQGERSMSWRNFSQIVETQSFFFLYRDKRTFFLIPTSAFENDEARSQFSELMQRTFSDYRRKLNR